MSGESSSLHRLARRLRRQHYNSILLENTLDLAASEVKPPTGAKHTPKHPPIREMEATIERLRDQLARTHAEFDNYRKRQKREEQQRMDWANLRLIEQLLPVLDNFERAQRNPGETVEGLLGGLEMVRRQLGEALQQSGLEMIETLGKDFDPKLHEAVSVEQPAEDQTENQVVEVFQEGYTLKGRLIRPAMVKVARAQ